MRYKFLIFFVLLSTIAFCQSYEDLMEQSSSHIQEKNFERAYSTFLKAFKDSSKIGIYDLTSAAFVAVQVGKPQQGIDWLQQSIDKGLGKNKQELDYILRDSSFIILHSLKEWKKITKSIKDNYVNGIQKLKNDSISWINEITDKEGNTGKLSRLRSGFTLNYEKHDDVNVPYLVYIPKKFNHKTKNNIIVYLHGGVANTHEFNYQDPQTKKEPIFKAADSLNFMVIYPFGKKSFGWVNQPEAFENILSIIRSVKHRYSLEKGNIYFGGMSNGGTATFWFASQKPNIFSGFFAISAFPKLNFEELKFENISQGKPFYSLNDQNDKVYNFEEVEFIYNQQKAKARDWKFDSITNIGHGFIYNHENGINILTTLIKELIESNQVLR